MHSGLETQAPPCLNITLARGMWRGKEGLPRLLVDQEHEKNGEAHHLHRAPPPSRSVDTILVGLLSFMLSDEITTGAVKQADSERKTLAAKSHAWNAAQPKFKTLFPEYAGERMKDLPNMSGKAPEPAGPQGEGRAPPGVSLFFALFDFSVS